MKICSLALFALLFFACANAEHNTADGSEAATDTVPAMAETPANGETPSSRMPAPPPQSFEKSLTDGTITFNISTSESGVSITTQGLENKQFSTEFKTNGPVTEAHLLDLNDDGFSEIYLVVATDDDSGKLELKAWSSYRNKSAGEIYVKDTELPRTMGSDRVYVEDGKLFRSFVMDSGESKRFGYKLTKGESSFVLEPVKK